MSPFTLTRDEVRELDRRAINDFGLPGAVLMENAGRGCADLLMRFNPERRPTVILCGPGNNGGDGFVIARHLDNADRPAFVWLLADETRLTGESALNCTVLQRSRSVPVLVGTDNLMTDRPDASMSLRIAERALGSPVWIVDALFGTGLSRELRSPYSDFVAVVNESRNPVLAVDIPSGLDCDTGEPLGPTVRATHTATFVAPKRGFLNPNSKQWTGEVHVIDIGAPRVLVEEYRLKANQ
jgi:NAD(P)H-hydrate epimerase